MHEIIRKYRRALSMLALVHIRGTRKYEAYSWLNDPAASNSTVMENIDALLRHLSAHTMGKLMDPEGLPHFYHMCCRAGMLVTTYYRSINDTKITLSDIGKYVRDHDFGHMVTPEELLSLSKEDLYQIPQEPSELIPFINNLLIMASQYPDCHSPKEDIWTDTSWADMVFIAICRLGEFIHTEINYNKYHKQMDGYDFTPEERDYFRKNLQLYISVK